ncbi:MAG: hypothetical protein DMG74_14675, partial [Acidobacteria bacterium]
DIAAACSGNSPASPPTATILARLVCRRELGAKIQQGRETAGLSLRALGKMVGISGEGIRNYELGARVPDADKLAKIGVAPRHWRVRPRSRENFDCAPTKNCRPNARAAKFRLFGRVHQFEGYSQN